VSSIAAVAVQTRDYGARLRTAAAGLEAWLLDEQTQLPLWAPVALGTGIVSYFLLPWAEQRLAVAVFAAAVGIGGLAVRGIVARVLGWGGLLVALGLCTAHYRTQSVAAPILHSKFLGQLSGTVTGVEIRSGRGQLRFTMRPDNLELPPQVRISLKASATSVPPPGIVPGAHVSLRAALNPPAGPSYPGGYDFARRAWFLQLGATGYPMGPVVVTAAAVRPSGAEARLDALRTRLTAQIESRVGGGAGAISAAFVTGDQGAIPEDINVAMRNSGLAHLLSISGVHIAIVVGGTMWGVRRLLALSPWIALRWPVKAIAAAAAAFAGIGYTILAGSEVPTVRSCIATVIVLLGIALGRDALSLRMIAAGAFFIILIRPEALLGPSFQLSFAAVTGLVSLYNSRLGRWLARAPPDSSWWYSAAHHGLALLVTGVVAEAMLSATALFHFNQSGMYGVLANLVAIPLTEFIIMPVLLLAMVLDTIGIAQPVWWLLGKSMDVLITVAVHVANWPGSVMRLPLVSPTAYGLLVAGGLWVCLWGTRWRWLGAAPAAVGAVLALVSAPPDLLVSADGRHAAVLIGPGEAGAGRLALLRERAGGYVRDMWGNAVAANADAALVDLPTARCSDDACIADINDHGHRWRLLATLSKDRIGRATFGPACAAADIVVSDRRLPNWCAPRWLKLDRAALSQSGAVAIWLRERRVESVSEAVGDHPWMMQPLVRSPYAYRRKSPASLP